LARLTETRQAALDAVMREGICEAAVKVLQEFGLAGTTMEKVAREAGAAKGTLYNYYRDKDALVQEVESRLIEPLFEALARIRDSRLPPARKLEEIVHEAMVFFERNRVTMGILHESGFKGSKKGCHFERMLDLLEPVIEEGVRDGSFRLLNARRGADLFFVTLAGFLRSLVRRTRPLDLEADSKELMDFLLHGLSAVKRTTG
jgi:AcrR family transcriptional regulator